MRVSVLGEFVPFITPMLLRYQFVEFCSKGFSTFPMRAFESVQTGVSYQNPCPIEVVTSWGWSPSPTLSPNVMSKDHVLGKLSKVFTELGEFLYSKLSVKG